MSQLEALPVELFLNVLQYLPLQSLYSLRLVSRSLNTIIFANASTIYHHAALLHDYVSSIDVTLADAKAGNPAYTVGDVDSWETFCK